MKKISVPLFLLILGFSFKTKAQNKTTSLNESPAVLKPELSVKISAGNNKSGAENDNSKVMDFIEGTIPSPEQQGFTKQNINGKDVYVKEQGQLILQYIPN
jgi:hypothetical protein